MAADKPVRAVGDKVWVLVHESWRRRFGDAYRWHEGSVIGETSRSWEISFQGWRKFKYPKSGKNPPHKVAWTEREKNLCEVERKAEAWISDRAYQIGEAARSWVNSKADNPDTHREVFHLCAKIEFDATPLFDLLAERDRLRFEPEPDPTPDTPQEAYRA